MCSGYRCLTYFLQQIEDTAVVGEEILSDFEELIDSSINDTKSLIKDFGDCIENVYRDQHEVVQNLRDEYTECLRNELTTEHLFTE